ncbi:hypothetical protein [uncultured Algibacter sp.]|uniref:hypothetical protein n=1 Tax=uncultured Algibacter sp. TaxID=298659 RepID=UPI0032174CC3
MKSLFLVVLTSIMFIFYSCKENAPNKAENSKDVNALKQENKILKPKQKQIVFNDGTKMNIKGNAYIKEDVDSIKTERKTFDAVYQYYGKSPLNKTLFKALNNKDDFKNINKITTAHAIIIHNKDTIYISGFEKAKCMKRNKNKEIAAKIYSIYTNNSRTNIMIIEDFL